jgi:hypothetical protein
MVENEKLKAIAIKVLEKSNVPKEDNYGFALVTILMIISIILTCVRILQECNKSKTQNMTAQDKSTVYGENIRSYSKKRGWFTRMRIKKIVRRELTSEEFNQYGIKLTESLLDIGEDLTDDEAYTLVEAANV